MFRHTEQHGDLSQTESLRNNQTWKRETDSEKVKLRLFLNNTFSLEILSKSSEHLMVNGPQLLEFAFLGLRFK